MADPNLPRSGKGAGAAIGATGNLMARGVGGLALFLSIIALYVLFVGSVFAGFASYIFRTDLATQITQSNGGEIDGVDTLFFLSKHDTDLKATREKANTEIASINSDMADLDALISGLDAERKSYLRRADLANQSAALFIRALDFEFSELDAAKLATLFTDTAEMPIEVRAGAIADTMLSIRFETQPYYQQVASQKSAPGATDIKVAFESQASELKRYVLEIQKRDAQWAALLSERGDHEARLEQFKTELARVEESLGELESTLGPFSDLRARINSICGEAWYLRISCPMVAAPTIGLTLIVTIAAGGLGSVVAYTRRLHENENDGGARKLLVNTGEGIAAAIAIFLFSGAGMLVLTQGSGAGSAVELSPYTVAFVAFLSGFMAEDAFGAIQRAGRKLFGEENNGPEPTPPGMAGSKG